MVESLGENPLQGRATQGLGEFLNASSLAMTKVQVLHTKVQDLQAEVQKMKEAAGQDAFQIKNLTQRETALYLKVSSFCQADKETKKLLFEKSQEVLRAHAKILDIRKEVIELQEKAEESQSKMAKLEKRATQQEVHLGQLEGELAHKGKLFKQKEEELTNEVADAYSAGFEDAIAQVVCVHPGVDLSQVDVMKRVIDGQLVAKE